jgi:Na+-driven multidrug efflux pump
MLILRSNACVNLNALNFGHRTFNYQILQPATTFIDGSVYLFAFLNVATTNLYSSSRAQHGEQSDKTESVVRTASRVALFSGIGLLLFLLAFARPLLSLYIGEFERRLIVLHHDPMENKD